MKARLINDRGEKTYALIFETGDEAIAGMTEFAATHSVTAAHFTAIGAFQEATLAYFDVEIPRTAVPGRVTGRLEIGERKIPVTLDISTAVIEPDRDPLVWVFYLPKEIARVHGLEDSDAFDSATNDLPGEASALVFLNLDELQGLAEQAGLAEAPLYAQLSDDISNFGSLGLAVTGNEEELRTELFLATD